MSGHSLREATRALAERADLLRPHLLRLLASTEGLQLDVDFHRGDVVVLGTGDARDLARAINHQFLRHGRWVHSRRVGRRPGIGKAKAFSFHWSNAQASWDVIVATTDVLDIVEGSDFILWCPLTSLSPIGKPWTLVEMRYVAKQLQPHPWFGGSAEQRIRASSTRA